MLGLEYKWLLSPVQPAAVERTQLARRSFSTLAVAAFCLVCAFVTPAPSLPSATAVTAPVTAAIDQTAPEWPRALIQLWFVFPHFLPGSR